MLASAPTRRSRAGCGIAGGRRAGFILAGGYRGERLDHVEELLVGEEEGGALGGRGGVGGVTGGVGGANGKRGAARRLYIYILTYIYAQKTVLR